MRIPSRFIRSSSLMQCFDGSTSHPLHNGRDKKAGPEVTVTPETSVLQIASDKAVYCPFPPPLTH